MILALRTDNPTTEIYFYEPGGKKLHEYVWQADRQLAKDLLKVLVEQLAKVKAGFSDLTGIIVFEGPGSFTGLRIGITVANTIAYAQEIPIVGTKGEDWIKSGLDRLVKGETDKIALPHYGAEANISKPKR